MSLKPAKNCQAVVVACIDFRFQDYLRDWTDRYLKGRKYDRIGLAGSSKDLKAAMKQIEISVKLHHPLRVILIHHENCGAYGKEGRYQTHVQDLRKSQKSILKAHPQLKVELFYVFLNGRFKKVPFYPESD